MGWVLPVGTPGGVNSGFAGMKAGSGVVRLGSDMLLLDLDSYRLWQYAAIGAEAQDVVDWGVREGIADANDLVRALVEAGLLLRAGPSLGQVVGLLAVRLTGECLGNGAESSTRFGVVGRDGVRLEVDLYSFEVLLRSDGVSPISIICGELERARPGVLDRPFIDLFAEGLPLLVRHGVVRLDAAR
jgi:hypothetical protein